MIVTLENHSAVSYHVKHTVGHTTQEYTPIHLPKRCEDGSTQKPEYECLQQLSLQSLKTSETKKLSISHNAYIKKSCYIPGGSDGKVSACSAEDQGSIHGLGRSPGEGNGNPLQYSSLENSMD